MLDGRAIPRGFRLDHRDDIGSTNEEALGRARAGDPGRLWIVADRQTAGRGRLGRGWSSPAGNLYASLLLVDPCEPRHAPQIGFVAGVALVRALENVAGTDDRRFALKWPNDVLHGGAKLAGILVEGASLPDGGFGVVLGFGLNCTSHPEGLLYPATHLAAVLGPSATRDVAFTALSGAMAEALLLWRGGIGFAEVRRAWLDHALPRGAALIVARPEGRCSGTFDSIDADGRLILDTDRGVVTVEAGDVFLADRGMTAAS